MTYSRLRSGESASANGSRPTRSDAVTWRVRTSIDGDAEIRLIDDVQDIALGVEREIAAVAVGEAALIQVDETAALAVAVEIADPPGVAFGCLEPALAGERQSHEDAAPIVVVGLRLIVSGRGHDLADVPVAGFLPFEQSQGIAAGAGVRGGHHPAGGAYRETERAGTGGVLDTEGEMTRPPGRIDAPVCRAAGRTPAGAEYVCASERVQ